MSEYNFRKYKESDKYAVISLLSNLWNRNLKKIEMAFDWKYQSNPYFSNDYMYVAKDGEKVVGFRGFFFNDFLINKEKIGILSPSDMFIHSNYRRKGIFTALTNYSIQKISHLPNVKLFLNMSSNQKSTPGYLKMGWKRLCGNSFLYSRSFSGYTQGKLLYRLKRSKLGSLLTAIDYSSFLFYSDEIAGNMEISSRIYPKEMAELDLGQNINNTFFNSKSREYYEWRYKNPLSKYHNIYYRDSTGKLLSFLTLKKGIYNDFTIINYSYSNIKHFLDLVKFFYSRIKISYVKAYNFDNIDKVSNHLLRLNFFKPNLLYKINRRYNYGSFLVKPNNRVSDNKLWNINDLSILDKKNWFLLPIDSDGI